MSVLGEQKDFSPVGMAISWLALPNHSLVHGLANFALEAIFTRGLLRMKIKVGLMLSEEVSVPAKMVRNVSTL